MDAETLAALIERDSERLGRVEGKVDQALDRIAEIKSKLSFLEGKAAMVGALSGVVITILLKLLGV